MYYFLLILLIIDGLLLGAAVLLQAGQGGGLASFGGGTTDLVVGGRQAATLLSKASWVCGGIFMFLALLLSLVSPARSGSEVLDRLRETQAPASGATTPLPLNTPSGTGSQSPSTGSQAAPVAPTPAPQTP